jgi:hypothetical protein
MAKKTENPEQVTKVTPEPESDLAFRICSRTGMGLTICRERMAGNEEVLEELLSKNEIASIVAILEPSNKA